MQEKVEALRFGGRVRGRGTSGSELPARGASISGMHAFPISAIYRHQGASHGVPRRLWIFALRGGGGQRETDICAILVCAAAPRSQLVVICGQRLPDEFPETWIGGERAARRVRRGL